MMPKRIVGIHEESQAKESIDWQVIAACQLGDRNALRAIFDRYKDRVYSIALYSLGGDRTAAADITQQVFLKVMTRIGQFRGDSDFATWLYRMAVNTCHDERRKQSRFVSLSELDSRPARTESPRANYARLELTEHVQAVIAELKPKLRWPILLKYVEGLSYEEIAKVLGCSKGTVASRLNRGHKALARRLQHLRNYV
jgi:RNA polymerase sigma-70 factor (ECF subfamily)